MKSIFQFATMAALAIDVASTVMLYWTMQGPGQDAAGKGMATGFFAVTIAATVAAALLLLISYWTTSWWPAIAALILAALPIIPVVLPALL